VLEEIESLVQAHPYDERLRCQLMLALYRGGRQVDALAVVRDPSHVRPGQGVHALERDLHREPRRGDASALRPLPPADPGERGRQAAVGVDPGRLPGRGHHVRRTLEVGRRAS
jgi:hypothetical protein